jgi:DNA gyrase/topoisomerase IV subunit B
MAKTKTTDKNTDQYFIDRAKALSDVEHVRLRPGMYIGSRSSVTSRQFVLTSSMDPETQEISEGFEERDVEFVPGVIKLIDEILSNSIDEYRRDTNLGLDEINVTIKKDGTVTIHDNGGIRILWHPEYQCYLPELYFGTFRAGSNFEDDEERSGVGTNGVGSTLANIFSTKFCVTSCDGKQLFVKTWCDAMKPMMYNGTDWINPETANPEEVAKSEFHILQKTKKHFTEISFKIDLEYFELEEISDDMLALIQKRCIDAAASNPGLNVTFWNGEDNCMTRSFKFESFRDYVLLYPIDEETLIGEKNTDWEFFIAPDSYIHCGLVNGAPCNSGTHFNLLNSRVNDIIQHELSSVHSINVSHSVLTQKYSCFICLNVINPAYDSQTKDKLETKYTKFNVTGNVQDFSKPFKKILAQSEIVNIMVDWYKNKMHAEESKMLRNAHKTQQKIVKIRKLVDANAGSKERGECELWLFEGDSAKTGFRNSRIAAYQACYALRGKIKNVVSGSFKDILNNVELRDIIAAINLKLGEPDNIENLRYKKIIICSDMDPDGHCICGQLIAFFYTFFPGLVKAGMLYRAHSPLIIAKTKGQKKQYYSFEDFEKEKPKLGGWHIRYIKGLGGLEAEDYEQMLQDSKLEQMQPDEGTEDMVDAWFKGNSQKRKDLLEAHTASNN